jgi:hypothetical protein
MSAQKKSPPKDSSRYWEDSDWAIDNAQMLSEEFPNQWVAIHNKKVIANNKNLGEVVGQAGKLGIDEPVFKFVERGFYANRYSVKI